MAYSTITKPSLYFNTKLYTGNGTDDHAITGVGFQPDWVWLKNRSTTNSHYAQDVVRGATKNLKPDATDAEETRTGSLKSFDSDGFTLGTETAINGNGNSLVSWNWKANGQGSANTDGSINTTYTSVNATAGFSISKYTGTGANATVGHGLGAVPKWIIVKRLDSGTTNWQVYHSSMGAEKYIQLNTTSGQNDSDVLWNDTEPTNQVFSLGNYSHVNYNGSPHIAYCFAEKTGYSKFGSYTGNGNADGAFIYTGFKPAWFLQKRIDSTNDWHMHDNKRDTINPLTRFLMANSTNSESNDTSKDLDFLSNGIKLTTNHASHNASGGTYIYMAFAEEPLVVNVGANGIPATAR